MSALDDLAAIAPPEGVALTLGGRDIVVMPLRVRDIAPLARLIRPFGERLMQGLLGAGLSTSEVLDLLAEHGDAFLEAVALAAQQDTDWVADLPPHDLMRLLAAAVEVNDDFFVRWLLPTVTATAMTLTRALGGMSPPGSMPPATPTG